MPTANSALCFFSLVRAMCLLAHSKIKPSRRPRARRLPYVFNLNDSEQLGFILTESLFVSLSQQHQI